MRKTPPQSSKPRPRTASREASRPTSFGHFSDDGSEYVVTTPFTPRPWVNYLTNGDYCALCSQVGGGFSFYRDHRFNAVLRRGWHQHIEDLPARLVYLKDEETGETWTANVHPIGKFDTFEARHGMGSTQIESSYRGVRARLRFFVPPDFDAELWSVDIENLGSEPRRLSIYSLADFTLGNVSMEEESVDFMRLFNELSAGERHFTVQKRWWHTAYGWHETESAWPWRLVFAVTRKPDRMMTDRHRFLGAFRGFHNPAALEAPFLPGRVASGQELVGACQWRIALPPRGRWSTHIGIGVQPNEDNAANERMIERLLHPATYATAREETRAHWRTLFGGIEVRTPEPDINHMVNWWNKHQLTVNFHFGRGPSYYHKGQYPAMRDSSQDAFGMIALAPSLARKNLARIAGFFFRDGRATAGCNRVGEKEGPSIKVDVPLWFGLAVVDYLRETGDLAFLDEQYPLQDGGRSSVFQKLTAGIDRMLEQRGPHGLPLIGQGDWNDAANSIGVKGRGESVWLAQFLYLVINEVMPLLRRKGDRVRLRTYERRAAELRRIVNGRCWNGRWFLRAFRDDGRPVGCGKEKEGALWINSQTWAVIARISDAPRLNRCMDSVEKHLGTRFGLTSLGPAYTQVDETIGLITRIRGGWKENGGVFSHANAFNVVARAMLGRGKDAVDLYRRVLPMSKDPAAYLMEPYVYSQFCVGPGGGEDFGRGSHHWLTGTGAWMFRAMLDYILGVRAEFEGLRISPAVDPSWKTFSVRRQFRGAMYHIRFENPDGVETGVAEILLDGRRIEGDRLPLPTAARHEVRVRMGAPPDEKSRADQSDARRRISKR